MHYQVSRNGQTYGPYTFEDLERYVASGNVLLSDMAKSEEMTDWVPVSQLLGNRPGAGEPAGIQAGMQAGGQAADAASGWQSPPAAYAPVQGGQPVYNAGNAPGYPQAGPIGVAGANAYPDPPSLHWGLVLLFGILTCGLFFIVWEIVQAAWMRRVDPTTKALLLYVAAAVLLILIWATGGVNAFVDGMAAGRHQGITVTTGGAALSSLLHLAYLVAIIAARFVMRASLERHFNTAEPIGLRLSGVMTFFFGGLYFQYHMTKIKRMKDASRMGLPRPY